MIGTISRLNDALYYLLVAGCPVLGWVLLGPSLFFLRFGKLARRRARALPRIQRSQKQLGLTMAAPGNTSDTFITIDLPEDGTNIGSDVGNLTKPHDKEEEEENSYNHTNTNIGGPYTIAVRAHGSLSSEVIRRAHYLGFFFHVSC